MVEVKTTRFSELLQLVSDEHSNVVHALQTELTNLRQGLTEQTTLVNADVISADSTITKDAHQDTHKLSGFTPTSSRSGPPDTTGKDGDEHQARGAGSFERGVIRQNSAASFNSLDTVSTVKSSTRRHSRYKFDAGDGKLKAKMNWKLAMVPSKQYWSSQVASRIGAAIGVAEHKLQPLLLWWSTFEEPPRSGICASIVVSRYFGWASLSVIMLNTVYISIVTDMDMMAAVESHDKSSFSNSHYAIICEVAFALFYAFEAFLKLWVSRVFYFIGVERCWNCFDMSLVVFSILDLSLQLSGPSDGRPNLSFLRTLRVLKLARILRVMRIVKAVQELRLLLELILQSVFHLFWCVVLMALFQYLFALILVQGLTAHVRENQAVEKWPEVLANFETVVQAAVSLFMATTNGWEWREQYFFVGQAGLLYRIVYVFYIVFFSIAIWNIVLSTFVEKALRLAVPDSEMIIQQKRREDLQLQHELLLLFSPPTKQDIGMHHDYEVNGVLTMEQFHERMKDSHIHDFFEARDMDIKDANLVFKMLASVQGSTTAVEVETLVAACLKLRGAAKGVDLHTLHYDLRRNALRHDSRLDRLEEMVHKKKSRHSSHEHETGTVASPGVASRTSNKSKESSHEFESDETAKTGNNQFTL